MDEKSKIAEALGLIFEGIGHLKGAFPTEKMGVRSCLLLFQILKANCKTQLRPTRALSL